MRLQAPEFTKSAEVDGVPYEVDEDGCVTALNPDHAAQLQRLGFRDLNAPAPAPAPSLAPGLTTGEAVDAAAALNVWDDFPNISRVLSRYAVPAPELTGAELLALVEAHIAEQTRQVEALEFGEFVGAALADTPSSVWMNLDHAPNLQVVFDAIEAKFEPFKAFDPDGDSAPGGAHAAETEDDGFADTLYGSSVLPAIVELGDYRVQLGGVVAAAFAKFEAGREGQTDSVAAWNALPEAEREDLLGQFVAEMIAAPDTVEAVIPAASIVERPAPAQDGAGGEAPTPPVDPAERPDFDAMPHADLKVFLGDRGYKFRGNPSQATLAVQANEYWDEKHGKRDA